MVDHTMTHTDSELHGRRGDAFEEENRAVEPQEADDETGAAVDLKTRVRQKVEAPPEMPETPAPEATP